MQPERLKNIVATILVSSHLGLLVLVGIETGLGNFTTDEMFILLGILGPLFAAYTAAVVRHILRDQKSSERESAVGRAKAILVVFLPCFFVFGIATGIFWKAHGPLAFENLIKLVGAVETAIGAYVGLIVEDIFGLKSEAEMSDSK